MESDKNERACDNCGEVEAVDLGWMPSQVFFDTTLEEMWLDVDACPHCGDMSFESWSHEDVKEADERIVEFMKENDLITDDDASFLEGK